MFVLRTSQKYLLACVAFFIYLIIIFKQFIYFSSNKYASIIQLLTAITTSASTNAFHQHRRHHHHNRNNNDTRFSRCRCRFSQRRVTDAKHHSTKRCQRERLVRCFIHRIQGIDNDINYNSCRFWQFASYYICDAQQKIEVIYFKKINSRFKSMAVSVIITGKRTIQNLL